MCSSLGSSGFGLRSVNPLGSHAGSASRWVWETYAQRRSISFSLPFPKERVPISLAFSVSFFSGNTLKVWRKERLLLFAYDGNLRSSARASIRTVTLFFPVLTAVGLGFVPLVWRLGHSQQPRLCGLLFWINQTFRSKIVQNIHVSACTYVYVWIWMCIYACIYTVYSLSPYICICVCVYKISSEMSQPNLENNFLTWT